MTMPSHSRPILDVLKKYWGYDAFRPLQQDIIESVLDGKDTLGLMPTGGGKSITFQVPAMVIDGMALVVTPIISLMKDQVDRLRSLRIKATYLYAGLTRAEVNRTYEKCLYGNCKFLYVSPERLQSRSFVEHLRQMPVKFIVVDEAHCISQWGYDFRPSFLRIAKVRKLFPEAPVLALTATATPVVVEDIQRCLNFKAPNVFSMSFARSNLSYVVRHTEEKNTELIHILRSVPGTAIVYVRSRKRTKQISDELNRAGISADFYHAGLYVEDKEDKQDKWTSDVCRVMVATNAFGMGIDKSDVSFVIHYNMPKNIESYYQEAGRAGRDGSPAKCILLYGPSDVRTNDFMIERSRDENTELSDEEKEIMLERDKERLKEMTFYSTATSCLREFMLRYFGEKAPSYCGNCSCCIDGFEEADITVDAQKIVSCVFRVKQKGRYFGKGMIVDILRGSENERLLSLGFDKLSTYGIMSDTPARRIRAELDHLAAEGYLGFSDGEYPVVELTALSARILKERIPVTMKLPIEKTEKKKKRDSVLSQDETLFAKLRQLRSRLAQEARVPAYIVFTDAALQDMCRVLPTTAEEFLTVSGVGRRKAEKYGEDFCALISEHLRSENDHQGGTS